MSYPACGHANRPGRKFCVECGAALALACPSRVAAPDSRVDGGWFWPALARHGAVTVTRRSGALADEFLWLFTVEHGRIARIEVFPLDDLDAARARFAELGAATTPPQPPRP